MKIVAGVGVWTELLEDSNAVCINGEVWTFAKAGVIAAQDTITPAFSTPAPASNDVPVYVYACGGRALPQAGSSTSPILLIESATPPDLATGRPSAALGTPRGNTTSACFIGCVWKRKNTTTRQKTRQVGEWAYYDQDSFSFEVGAGAAASADITLPSAPAYKEAGADSQAGCVRMLVRISHSVACTVTLRPKSGVMPMYEVFTDAPSGAVALDWGAVAEVPYDATGPQISIGIGAATAVTLRPIAYRVPVRRFAR